MTTLAQLRRTALALPETAERRSAAGLSQFTVRGKAFATLVAAGLVRLQLSSEDIAELLAAHPTARPAATWAEIPLADINGQQLNHWTRRAWLAQAPKRLADQANAADSAVPGEVGDLPKAIGKPATQALVNAGITTLAQVAKLTRDELAAMHGIGPKAVRLLGEALTAMGRSLRH